MSKIILYHGSEKIIQKPMYETGKAYKDYGKGFYCTKNLDLAKEWACTINSGGFVNKYEIDTDALNILDLETNEYTIIHWLALLMENRKVRISTPLMKRGTEWLKYNFHVDISGYDAIIGYRADDSYFSFARAFLNNEISLNQLAYAMKLGKHNEQFVLKSEKAFNLIKFVSYVPVNHTEYYSRRKKRDEVVRATLKAELEKDNIDGLYMRDIIREEVKVDDPRLR